MIPKFKAALLPLCSVVGLQLAFAGAQVRAQTSAPASAAPATARPDPADPNAQVPAALYASPLRAYQGFAEPAVASWREVNERVQQRGAAQSHGGEARESAGPQPTARAASGPAPAAKPSHGGHVGHPMK